MSWREDKAQARKRSRLENLRDADEGRLKLAPGSRHALLRQAMREAEAAERAAAERARQAVELPGPE